jgi:hypothetical protein
MQFGLFDYLIGAREHYGVVFRITHVVGRLRMPQND